MTKKLKKSGKNKILTGVCGGVAEYFNLDPTIVRLIFAVVGLLKGFGLILYVIAALVMPASEEDYDDVDNLKSANIDPEENTWSEKKEDTNKSVHSDEDFDKFFEK